MDNVQNRRLLYFADPVTEKSLKSFTDEAALLHEISLNEPSTVCSRLTTLLFFAPDTIVLNSRFTNKIAVINSKKHQLELDEGVKGVFVLSASGCMSCNKKFARLIEVFKNKPDLVVLVTAPSSRIDHSNLQVSNFYFDSKPEPFLEQLKAILLTHRSIDTILVIDAESVDRNLDYIMRKFK